MAQIGTVQLAGNANAGPVEVELNTLAERIVCRPNDYTYLGTFMCGATARIVNTAAANNYTAAINNLIYAFRNSGPGLIAIKKVIVSYINVVTGATGGYFTLTMNRLENFVYQYPIAVFNGGTVNVTNITLGGVASMIAPTRLRGSAASSMADIVAVPKNPAAPSATGGVINFLVDPTSMAAVAGVAAFNSTPVGTVDAQPMATWLSVLPATPGSVGPVTLFEQRSGEHPLVLTAATGFNFNLNIPGTASYAGNSNIDVGVTVHWDELSPNTW